MDTTSRVPSGQKGPFDCEIEDDMEDFSSPETLEVNDWEPALKPSAEAAPLFRKSQRFLAFLLETENRFAAMRRPRPGQPTESCTGDIRERRSTRRHKFVAGLQSQMSG
jgi:hypothetical protein